MNFVEMATATAAACAAAGLALSTLSGVMDDVTDGQWSRSAACVETVLLVEGVDAESTIDGYLTGTVDPSVKEQVDACVRPLVDTPNRNAAVPPEVLDLLGGVS